MKVMGEGGIVERGWRGEGRREEDGRTCSARWCRPRRWLRGGGGCSGTAFLLFVLRSTGEEVEVVLMSLGLDYSKDLLLGDGSRGSRTRRLYRKFRGLTWLVSCYNISGTMLPRLLNIIRGIIAS